MEKQYLDEFEIEEHNTGWINVETGEIGDFKNGKPKRKPFWMRLCGRTKIDLYNTEYLGTTEVEHFFFFKSTGLQKAAVYRKYNKFTNKTKDIWVTSGGSSLNFSPEAWDRSKQLVDI